LQCGRVFEFFYWPALAADSHRHHCLAALRGNERRVFPSSESNSQNVQALFDATLGQ
jgi:hypothetical protein